MTSKIKKTSSLSAKRPSRIPLREVVIVALDHETPAEAMRAVKILKDNAGYFKIGLKTYLAGGEELVARIKDSGAKVFLDLKFHDIPDQVASAGRLMARMGVDMFTVHASGGPEMLKAVALATSEEARALHHYPPAILGVTILTSLSDSLSRQIFGKKASAKVIDFFALAEEAGLGGIVCSARELTDLPTARPGQRRLLRVTPGIRPSGKTGNDDQSRVATPASAILDGADHLVIGRPITGAKDPLQVYSTMLSEVKRARSERSRLERNAAKKGIPKKYQE